MTDDRLEAVERGVLLEIAIDEAFVRGVREQSRMGSAGRAPGFHVSGLSYDCLRNIQYSQMEGKKETSNLDQGTDENEDGLFRMWIGTQLHATPMSWKHEWPLYRTFEVNGRRVQVHGHIDEIFEAADGSEVVIDKKFVARLPRSPHEHHVRQVQYYSALYHEQTGAEVTEGALLYFCPYVTSWKGAERKRVFTFPVDTKKAMAELEQKVRAVQEAIDSDRIVDRTTGWLCKYCPFKGACEALSGPVNGRAAPVEDSAQTHLEEPK